MMTSILLNPQLLITSGILGPEAVAVRFISCFAGGLGAGICVRYFYKNRSFFDFTGFFQTSKKASPGAMNCTGGCARLTPRAQQPLKFIATEEAFFNVWKKQLRQRFFDIHSNNPKVSPEPESMDSIKASYFSSSYFKAVKRPEMRLF